jgi:hypothetical protein
MMVEDPGPQPFYGAYWTGGYWVWDGQWVWAHGRWLAPPYAGYGWNQPYYENRGGMVVFVPGYWRAPGAVFIAPAIGVTILMVEARPGAVRGPRCDGPDGVFVPPPPGSRHGLIVPAPVGTAPAVVVGSPPVIHRGMRIRGDDADHVRIEAPAGVTANGRPLAMTAPRLAHLAAAQQPVVRVAAPPPASATPIRSYSPRQGFARLPEARPVRPVIAQPDMVRRPAAPAGQRPVAQPRPQQPEALRPQAQPQRPELNPRPQFDERRDAVQQRLEQAPRPQPVQPPAQRYEPAQRPAQQYVPPPRVPTPQPNVAAPRAPQVQRPAAPPPEPAAAPHPAQPPAPAAAPKPRNEREEKDKERRP